MKSAACACALTLVLFVNTAVAGRAAVTPPRPIDLATPAYPPALREQGIVGHVDITALIDEQGVPRDLVLDYASLPEFGPPALAAVATWRFSPAQQDGKPVARRYSLPISFDIPEAEITAKETARLAPLADPSVPFVRSEETDSMPELTKSVPVRFPAQIKKGAPFGEALVGLVVDENGQPQDVHLITATHPAYGEESVRAIQQWRFSPGRANGQPARIVMHVIMSFFPDDPKRSGPRVKPGVVHFVPERDIARFPDPKPNSGEWKNPKPISRKPPEYPPAAGGAPGRAMVDFVINAQGVVTHVRCESTTHRVFALEAERAVSYWRFEPALRNGKPAAIHARQQMLFGGAR